MLFIATATDSFVTLTLSSSVDPLRHAACLRLLSQPSLFCSPADRGVAATVRFARRLHRFVASSNVAFVRSDPLLFPREGSEFATVSDPLADLYKMESTAGYGLLNTPTADQTPIVIDSGASVCLTPFQSDFITPIKDTSLSDLNGLSSTTKVVGEGTVSWTVYDMFGTVRTIKCTAYYVPDASIRLYSPQQYFQERSGGNLYLDQTRTTLTLADGSQLSFPFSCANLPWMLPHVHEDSRSAGFSSNDSFLSNPTDVLLNVADEMNQNITAPQRELLLLHQKLGHADMARVQALCRRTNPNDSSTSIVQTKAASVANVPAPMCAACQLGKQKRTPRAGRHIVAPHSPVSKTDALTPGASIFLDQYVSSVPGRLPHTRGLEKSSSQYTGGLLGVDAASGKVFVRHQVSLRTGETIGSLRAFYREASQSGVCFRHFRADNHPFRSAEFRAFVEEGLSASIDYSGVGAQHQNAVAERAIQTVMSWARTLMLHAIIHWPIEADPSLWPFAVDHAVYLWNHLPGRDLRLAPDELFSGGKFPSYGFLNSAHVWGCPIYVLDPKLQDGRKLPKWTKRARRGQYLGISPEHSSTVARVRHLTTGNISPQFHVVFDDLFSTVPAAETGPDSVDTSCFDSHSWSKLVQFGLERFLLDEYDDRGRLIPLPVLDDTWSPTENLLPEAPLRSLPPPTSVADEVARLPSFSDPVTSVPEGELVDDAPASVKLEPPSSSSSSPVVDLTDEIDAFDEPPPVEPAPPAPDPAPDPSLRRSSRVRKPRKFFDGTFAHYNNGINPAQRVPCGLLNQKYLNSLNWHLTTDKLRGSTLRRLTHMVALDTDPDTNEVDWLNPMAFGAKANSEDTPTWDEALGGPDAAGFWQAMEIEIDTLVNKRDAWTVVDRLPTMNVLPSTWAFKVKRLPDGSIKKLKARFCVRGDRQIQDVDFFDTFCPVVHWNTVRLMLILSAVLRLCTRQVDYVAAFVQAPCTEVVYVEMARGFAIPGKVLKLKRNLYGTKQGPRNFFLHLSQNLEKCGLKSCPDIDPCLFVSDRVICLVYVDDTLFFSPKDEYITETIDALRRNGMDLEEEDSVSGFLGVHVDHNTNDGTVVLTQVGLTERIIQLIGTGGLPPMSARYKRY